MNSFATRIVKWFCANARDLPWRKTSDPYKIWISEVMLQQTTVATVIPYYEKFLNLFPRVEALANSSEEEVLRAWQGLGYYRRAKNLRAGAQFVLERFKGEFPKSIEELMEIPGVGRYSAGAILSIAHRIPAAALDGNLIRVYARHLALVKPVDDPKVLRFLWNIATENIPSTSKHAREFTEGMMELGALVCTPKNPNCARCPVASTCVARQMQIVERIPIKSKREVRKKLHELVLWSEKNGKLAFLPKGSDPKFPDFFRLPFKPLSAAPDFKEEVHRLKYSVTDRDFQVYLVRRASKRKGLKWLTLSEVDSILLPTIDRKIIRAMGLRKVGA